ncbi:hypothetical protein GKZ89_01815 [Bacillus mangrovi]|uniref:Uncharacterized protein n=1 Tax=Metabacillus mangrovi TaxID=1491830 RepID=A0A7X2V388_9BACI|nr:hypothetical protein [Metabacillus mangrovi]MTH52125.1 hypothetical protein [Metabacillus mangrovi]
MYLYNHILKERVDMGRGAHYNHKKKGHESETPAYGKPAEAKMNEHAEYSIGTVASEGDRPVVIESVKD